ncbi:DUF2254 family protein [Marinobacterium aestuariivivens]|uniref:DUF2254 family protein n=1 Tax=Marinobacterium aestuariivivens TaxID=1698799 RepID=A0ABW1ZT66_9GAMM
MTRRSNSNKGGLSRFLKQGISLDGRLGFLLNRVRERLWVKPLAICLLSILVVFLAGLFEALDPAGALPEISLASIEKLLTVMSSSMLVMAVLAVGAMLSAYTSASNGATPRAFAVVVADDVSQNALSTFIGAFIFSTIALVALLNDYYDRVGRLALFLLTIAVFAVVILSFVRWVDRIARLGRMGETIDKVEAAAGKALRRRRRHPTLGAREAGGPPDGVAVQAPDVGYVQHIDVAALQLFAEDHDLLIRVVALPGTFVSRERPGADIGKAGPRARAGEPGRCGAGLRHRREKNLR